MSKASVSKQDLLATQLRREDAQRIAALWQKPLLSDTEAADAIGLAYSSYQLLKARNEAPETFHIGRRVYVRTDTLRKWINERATAEAA
jgi:hypothetical protein